MTLPAAVPQEGAEEIPGSSFVGDKQIGVEAEEEIAVSAKLFEFGEPGIQTPHPLAQALPARGEGASRASLFGLAFIDCSVETRAKWIVLKQ